MRIVFHLSTQAEVEVKRQGDPDDRRGEGGEQPRIATIAPEQCERPQQVELLFDRERPCEVEVVLSGERVVSPVKEACCICESCAGGCENLPDSEVRRDGECSSPYEQHHDRHRDD